VSHVLHGEKKAVSLVLSCAVLEDCPTFLLSASHCSKFIRNGWRLEATFGDEKKKLVIEEPHILLK